jgi:FtsP/CotA-like multicopper oxidase with cupredoxin domain
MALRLPEIRLGGGLPPVLAAAAGSYDLGDGPRPGALLFNDRWPSPTLRIAPGERFRLDLLNQLGEDTIVHWHGLRPPANMDGHPSLVIPSGASRPYDFTVTDPAGTHWYHPHPHHRTGYQVYHGLAGFLIVDDGLDAERGLPTGARDLPLMLADKRLDNSVLVPHNPTMAEMMAGYLGNTVLVNGQVAPVHSVEPAVHRLRLLNGSTARILNPAFQDGRPFWLIGTDAGLLPAPVEVTGVLLAPGERVEILVDLRGSAGQTLQFNSAAFTIAGGSPPTAPAQGTAFPMMQFRVELPLADSPGSIPKGFGPIAPPPTTTGPVRLFQLTQQAGQHFINGRTYEIGRVDFEVTCGQPEIWRFTNAANFPHPMHMHGAHFRVLSRTGTPLPTDAGWKDTVLVRVGETVDIALRFDVPGLFVLHCHNLEHEDMGMMLNFVVDSELFRDGFEAG